MDLFPTKNSHFSWFTLPLGPVYEIIHIPVSQTEKKFLQK